MIKKIVCVLLCITLLSSCGLGNKLTAFGLYSKAVSDIRSAGGVEAECEISMLTDLINVSMEMKIKISGRDSDISVYMDGEEISRVITVGEDVYSMSFGEKKRSKRQDDENKPDIEASDITSLTEEMFEGIEIAEDENGKSLGFELSGETLEKLMDDFGMGAGSIQNMISFNSADITMYFTPENEISSMKVEADAKLNILLGMAAKMTADYKIVNLGETPEITAPEDAEEYVEDTEAEEED